MWQNGEIKDPYRWTSSTIAGILAKPEYLGHTVNFKTRKHFKDKRPIMLINPSGRFLRTLRSQSLIKRLLITSRG